MKKTDVLVIGSGIAGLSFALKIASLKPEISISILTKSNNEAGSTSRAQGGIAVVSNKLEDSFQSHFEDTMKAGKYLNDPEVVRMVVSQAPARLEELIAWGGTFDTRQNGEFDLGLEGGHSNNRIVHRQDFTGLELERKLLEKVASKPNIELNDHYFVTDLLLKPGMDGPICVGASAIDLADESTVKISARMTLLATGGSGKIFENTTNPSVATADGVAMAYRAGASVKDMNFIQFHPTALYQPEKNALFLISEAVRGYGAYLVNSQGKRFLFDYDFRGELATRDIVSAAILEELNKTGEDCVYLDCRHLVAEDFNKQFPTIVSYCQNLGIDLQTSLIPVIPAAHYQCGGIKVDKFARSSVTNLLASGECACTGLHGANRLASNSLLEALVYSHQAAEYVNEHLKDIAEIPKIENEQADLYPEPENRSRLLGYKQQLKSIMTYHLVYLSDKKEKERAWQELHEIRTEMHSISRSAKCSPLFYEIRNMVLAGILVIEHSILNNRKVKKHFFEGQSLK